MPEAHTCSICGYMYYGFGNNAEPVNHGRCCDTCNSTVVIPVRMNNIARGRRRDTPPDSVMDC